MPEGEEVKSLILLTCDLVCDVMWWLELGTRFREMSAESPNLGLLLFESTY